MTRTALGIEAATARAAYAERNGRWLLEWHATEAV